MIALDPLLASINPESLIHALSFQAPEAPTPLATYAIEMIAGVPPVLMSSLQGSRHDHQTVDR